MLVSQALDSETCFKETSKEISLKRSVFLAPGLCQPALKPSSKRELNSWPTEPSFFNKYIRAHMELSNWLLYNICTFWFNLFLSNRYCCRLAAGHLLPLLMAIVSALCPWMLVNVTLAPRSMSTEAVLEWPSSAAKCKGVFFSLSTGSTGWPAWCQALKPFEIAGAGCQVPPPRVESKACCATKYVMRPAFLFLFLVLACR